MAIKDRDIPIGTRLVARYKKETYTAEVVEGDDGKSRYRLEDGREFKSPSAAGSAVMGGNACNGWSFWSMEAELPTTTDTLQRGGQESLEDTQAQEPMGEDDGTAQIADGAQITTEELVPAKKRIFRVPNQQGVVQGETRYYCHDCGESFTVSTEETPQVCPKGHLAEK